MKKIWIFVLVGFLLIFTAIGLGGKMYMDKKEDQDEIILEAQHNLALYLVRNYEGVQKIEFYKFKQVEGLGYSSWNVTVNINDDNIMSFSIEDLSKVEDLTIRHNPSTFQLEERSEDSSEGLDDVQIIYWEGGK